MTARLALMLVVLSSIGCSGSPSTEASPTYQPNSLSDGEIAHVVRTVNEAQIDQAQVALPRLERADNRSFAERRMAEHSASNYEVTLLAQRPELAPEDNMVSVELGSESERTIATLREATDEQIDLAYTDSQVMSYDKLVKLFETQLLVDARDTELRAFLDSNRLRARDSLAEAEALDQTFTR